MVSDSELQKKLASLGIQPGDEIMVASGERELKGILIPHHEFSDHGIITIKLDSGYNVGVKASGRTRIELLKKADASPFGKQQSGAGHTATNGLRRVAFAGTGGTIASFVDYRTGGVFPAMDAAGIVSLVPEISRICSLEGRNIFSFFSENIGYQQWCVLAEEIADRLNEGYSGVLVSHGTDTLSYTAAALSFMLPRLSGPVSIVGAQRSPDRPSFDGYLNLVSAARVSSSSDIGEVVAVMHASSSDRGCHVHRGTKVRKMHSSRRDAFRSVNAEPIAFVDDEIHFLSHYRKSTSGRVRADTRMENEVALLQFYPDMDARDLMKWTDGKKGVVVAGTGLGHVNSGLVDAIGRLTGKDVPVVVTTQCLYGSVDLNVYATGRDLIKAGVIDGKDMLPEVAYVKLRHVLAHHSRPGDIRKAMMHNAAGEFNDRRTGLDEF